MGGYTITLGSVAGIAREFSQTDSNGLTNQKVLDFANASMLKQRKYLVEHGIDAATVQETLGTITDGVSEYAYPDDMWLPKEMEINWWNTTGISNTDFSSANNNLYVPVEKVQDTNLPQGATIGWLRLNQSANYPLVDYRGDYYEILPTPNASNWGGARSSTLSSAIRFFYYLQPTLYTDNANLTDSLAYPESIDYHSFAKLISAHYDYSIGKIDAATLESIIKFEAQKVVDMIQGEGKAVTKTKGIPLTGWEY